MGETDNHLKQEFETSFTESYPLEFSDEYIPMECLCHTDFCDTLLIVEKESGKKLIIKCYQKNHALFEKRDFSDLLQLNKKGIPKIVRVIENAEWYCLVREYIEGESLWTAGQKIVFSEEQILQTGIQLCEILIYLHTQKTPIIHRDIKPQNIILQEDGKIALIDFGICRTYQEGAGADTVFCGTHEFAPPEQYGYLQTDARSDIYSMGMLLTWMLEKDIKRNKNKKQDSIPQKTSLQKVLDKCTAFAPNKRYSSVAKVKKALQNILPKRKEKRKRNIIFITGMSIVCAVALFSIWMFHKPQGVTFKEPVIEKAVRTILDKSVEPITKEDLLNITELYIQKDILYSDVDAFYCADMGDVMERGEITTLSDLAGMKNLKIVCIAQERLNDISGIENLEKLDKVEFRYNEIEEITSLANKKYLSQVGLNSNPLKDISSLASCPAIVTLDLRCTGNEYDGSVLKQMDQSFALLDIYDASDCYKYLAGKTINTLKVGNSEMTTLDCTKEAAVIYQLDCSYSKITNISALTGREELKNVSMILCNINDMTPLLSLSALEQINVSEALRNKVEELGKEVKFEVKYY